jgi:hypothetical protein
MQYTIQYNTIQYNTIQYNTIQYNIFISNSIFCNFDKVEDELHFLFECPLYIKERCLFVNEIQILCSNFPCLNNSDKLYWLYFFASLRSASCLTRKITQATPMSFVIKTLFLTLYIRVPSKLKEMRWICLIDCLSCFKTFL